jgi:hypothetical protein
MCQQMADGIKLGVETVKIQEQTILFFLLRKAFEMNHVINPLDSVL